MERLAIGIVGVERAALWTRPISPMTLRLPLQPLITVGVTAGTVCGYIAGGANSGANASYTDDIAKLLYSDDSISTGAATMSVARVLFTGCQNSAVT